MTYQELELHWQTFLLTGFEDWVPLSIVAAAHYDQKPHEILGAMISSWVNPPKTQNDNDHELQTKFKHMAAKMGAAEGATPPPKAELTDKLKKYAAQ